MSILRHRPPSVHSLTGCKLRKPARTFGQGILPEAPRTGQAYWSDELAHLESLLAHATPSRRDDINRRIDSVMEMMFPF